MKGGISWSGRKWREVILRLNFLLKCVFVSIDGVPKKGTARLL